MEERTRQNYRPDLEAVLRYVQGASTYFGPEARRSLSHHLDHPSMIPPCVRGNLSVLGWTLVLNARQYLARSPLAENSLAFERFAMKQIIYDMIAVARAMSPMGMDLVPAMTIVHNLTNRLARILLMLQTATTTSRPRCLCCPDLPVPAPRVCGLSFKSIVCQISDGVCNAEVCILPPMREWDPPAYVTLPFNPCASCSFMTLFIFIMFQFPVNSIVLDVKRELDYPPGYAESTWRSSVPYCIDS